MVALSVLKFCHTNGYDKRVPYKPLADLLLSITTLNILNYLTMKDTTTYLSLFLY